MTKFKKIIVCVLALCIVSTAFSGCKDDDSSKKTQSDTSVSTEDTTESESIVITMTSDDTDLPEVTDTDGEYTSSVDSLDPSETVAVIKTPQTNAVNLEDYISVNPDTKAWIKIPGTMVNYPVLQAKDNNYYLHRNGYKQDSFAGSLYADFRNVITGSNTSDNVVIYGHNMANGTYFGSMNNFKSLSFYKQNPIVQFTTPDEKSTYVIVAVFYTNTVASQDNGNVWNYHLVRDFASKTDFNTWKDNVTKRSFYTTNFDYDISDEYLTLSTCSNVAGADAGGRLVTIARKTRTNEQIDTNKVAKNPNIYLPASWDRTKTLKTLIN